MLTDEPITIHRHLDHALIELIGDFDLNESAALDALAADLFAQFTATVEVDMSQVTFFGSRALGALMHLRNEVDRHSGAELRVSGCTAQIRRLFEMTGVLDCLPMTVFGPLHRMPDVA